MMSKAEVVFELAQQLASATPGFFEKKGAGEGDRATNKFMDGLRKAVHERLGHGHSEHAVTHGSKSRFDFYFPEEQTAVEIALSLWAPQCEYETDIFKCLLAQEAGLAVTRLVLISKPGGAAAHGPARRAIADFVQRNFGLEIIVRELRPQSV